MRLNQIRSFEINKKCKCFCLCCCSSLICFIVSPKHTQSSLSTIVNPSNHCSVVRVVIGKRRRMADHFISNSDGDLNAALAHEIKVREGGRENVHPYRDRRFRATEVVVASSSTLVVYGGREGVRRAWTAAMATGVGFKQHWKRNIQMEEDPTRNASRSGTDNPKRNRRFAVEETVDSVDCSSKSCRSCAAALIADCVAVSCCPLAVVSLLALAFVKVPYLVCRKCLKRRRRERKRKKIAEVSSDVIEASSGGCSSSGQGKSDIMFEFGGDEDEEELEDRKSFCAAALEADKVLFELYQVGHLGFGRVSFTGIQSLGKGS